MLVAAPEQCAPFFQLLDALLTAEGSEVQDMQDHKIIQVGKEEPWRVLVLLLKAWSAGSQARLLCSLQRS